MHPGETPASFLMIGLISFLLDANDPRAEILRRIFVFKIIPIINVDGVSRGFYRYDTNSLNMNRHYANPNQKMQPEIAAIKRIFVSYAQEGRIRYYYDLHAHASSRGLFLFGNNLDFLPQVENCVLPKILELNSEYLLFENCNFSEKSMKTKEKGDKFSKEGTGRVYLHRVCGLIHCYTVEASYYRGLVKNVLPKINYEYVNDYFGYFSNSNSNSINDTQVRNLNCKNDNDVEYKSLDSVAQLLAKFYNFNLHEFVKNRAKEMDSLISRKKHRFKKHENKDDSFEASDRSDEDSNSSSYITYSERYKRDYEKIASDNSTEKQIEINTHFKLFENNKKKNNDSNYNSNIKNRLKRSKTNSISNDESKFNYHNREKQNNFENLFYENRLENFDFLCASDEESFYTPIAYQKMGVSLLISILDYEGLNPFSRLYNSEFKEVRVVRENNHPDN